MHDIDVFIPQHSTSCVGDFIARTTYNAEWWIAAAGLTSRPVNVAAVAYNCTCFNSVYFATPPRDSRVHKSFAKRR